MKSRSAPVMGLKLRWCSVLIASILVNLVQAESDKCKLNTNTNKADVDLFGSTNLKAFKALRNDLVNHIKLIENMINNIDELAFEEISNITGSDKINQDNYNLYKSQVNFIQSNYTLLSEQLSETNNSNTAKAIKTESINLKTELESLKSNLDEKTVNGLLLVNSFHQSDNIIDKYESLCCSIDLLIKKSDEKEQSIIANNFIVAFKMNDFESAGNQLIKNTDTSKISYIINQIYSPKNYTKILNFTNKITSASKRYYILNDLNKEMRANGGITPNKLILLANSLSKNVINMSIYDSEITSKTMDLVDLVKTDIKTLTVMQLIDYLESDNIKKCDFKLLSNIYLLDSKLAFEICYQSYKITSANSQDVVLKFQEIFKYLIEDNISNTKVLINLIYGIKQFFVRINYPDYNTNVVNLVNAYETSDVIKSILFAQKIGLMKLDGGYLRSSADLSNNKYQVYTYSGNSFVTYEFWVLKHLYDDVYKILCYPFENYYLDVDKNDNVVLSSEESLLNGLWRLDIVDNEHTRINNVLNSKYLYASSPNNPAVTKYLDPQHTSGFIWKLSDYSDK